MSNNNSDSSLDCYRTSPEDLKKCAALFWPKDLVSIESDLSVIPKLLGSQDQFLSLFNLIDTDSIENIEKIFTLINDSNIEPNLFLKHLVIISDFGGEKLKRLNREFRILFPDNKFDFFINSKKLSYYFRSLPLCQKNDHSKPATLDNKKLGIDAKGLSKSKNIDDLFKDLSMLLIFGSNAVEESISDFFASCEIGQHLNAPEELDKFVKQRYIVVSRINAGATANHLGQITQKHVKEFIEKNLNQHNLNITNNGSLPGIINRTGVEKKFDIVVSDGSKYIGIEVSFQVTTNSTIERKSGQAKDRYELAEKNGFKIAYVIDGSGNFERISALTSICNYSHCTVAFTKTELAKLCEFITNYFSNN